MQRVYKDLLSPARSRQTLSMSHLPDRSEPSLADEASLRSPISVDVLVAVSSSWPPFEEEWCWSSGRSEYTPAPLFQLQRNRSKLYP